MGGPFRIGVYVCWCGSNIAKMVDVEQVVERMSKVPGVVVARDYKYMCSDPGQELIMKDIAEQRLDRVVVSSCSPRMHETTFRKALLLAGLNPYMLEMANIREHVSWVHEDRQAATAKALALTRAAVERVMFHEELGRREVPVNPATLVIGGGITGLTAATRIAGPKRPVYLVERSSRLGGHVADVQLTWPYMLSSRQLLSPALEEVEQSPDIQVLCESQVEEISGFVGSFNVKVRMPTGIREVEVGNIVVATGLRSFNPARMERYGYGKLPNVFTSVEFEKMAREGRIQTREGAAPRSIVLVHCVGSRDDSTHRYCSRTCCQTALKFSNQLRSVLPGAALYHAYADLRAFGKDAEEFYKRTAERDVAFLLYDKLDPPRVVAARSGDGYPLVMQINERATGEALEVPADMVILMVGMEAREDAGTVAKQVSISMDKEGFFIEKHPKLDPVATTTDGVFIAGACQGPKDIPDCMAQASAAAARVLAAVRKGRVTVEATTAHIDEALCVGCQTCVRVCPYGAVIYLADKRVSLVEEIICKGCGTCASACPAGATRSKHFTDEQILSQIDGLFAAGEG
jgi:heterodisulfide reductase subunit A